MDEFLKALKQKEKELRSKLERTPIFKQWESVKNTLTIFQNGSEATQVVPDTNEPLSVLEIHKNYHNEDLTWREKVLYALYKLQKASVTEIIAFLKKSGAKESDVFLTKRIGVTVSRLKVEEKVVDSEMDGKKGIYFIKPTLSLSMK